MKFIAHNVIEKNFLDFMQHVLWLDHGEALTFELNDNKYRLVRHNSYDGRIFYIENTNRTQCSNTLKELTFKAIKSAIEEIVIKEIYEL